VESLSIGGLASGLDTNAIIDGLSDLELVKVRREETKLEAIEDKKEAFNELATRIGTFSSKAATLDDVSNFNLFKATTNEDEIITVEGGEDATPGSFEVEVLSLASSQKVSSAGFSTINTGIGLVGSFEVSKTKDAAKNDPGNPNATIELLAGDSLKDIAAKINAADGIGVSASILTVSDSDNRLILTAKDEGSDSFFLNELTGSVLGATGLNVISDTQKVRSENNLLLQSGGPATATTTMAELSTGLGVNNLSNGDAIEITGTDANGGSIGPTDFTFNTTDTLQDFLSSIETAFSGSVSANLNSSGELILTDLTSGSTEMELNLNFKDNDSSGSTLQLGGSNNINSFANELLAGKKSFFKVDTLSVSSQGNKADNVVQGTKFNLLKAEVGTVAKVTLDRNTKGIIEKVKGFVDEFNSLLKFIDEKTKINFEEPEEGADGKSTVQSRGALAGDSTVRRIRNELRNLMTEPIADLNSKTQYTSLSRIGITSSTSDGSLKIDDEDLTKAIEEDFDGVRRLFAASGWSDNPAHEIGRFTKETKTGTYAVDTAADTVDGNTINRIGDVLTSKSGNSSGLSVKAPASSGSGNFTFVRGLASKIQQFYEQSNDFVDGLFKNTREGFDSRIRSKEERIDRLATQAENYRSRLIKQFADLEQSMSRLQQQSSAFLSQIGSL
jgi:flagellar hook-associated protein 2